ncbi:MAG TPA: hypothetical protein VEX36_02495 [Thermoleophilaceae bacterium]|nr:hypothetical protein [Thermoleophilaceae bacterium]
MTKRAATSPGDHRRRWRSTPAIAIAGAACFVALGGSAVAAKGLIHSKDIAKGAVTSKTIGDGAVMPWHLNRSTRMWVKATTGPTGAKGDTGATGTKGDTGSMGAPGSTGSKGIDGIDGSHGTDGIDGAPGADGIDGAPGSDGADGIDGAPGTDGADGTDGIIAPLTTTAGLTPLPTASPPTVVVGMTVPAGNYVVWAKTQLSHTGAGDSIDCALKAGGATLDQISMKTLPALAAIPVSMQAVTTTSPTQLSVECDVLTANGSANFSSLIAIPTG